MLKKLQSQHSKNFTQLIFISLRDFVFVVCHRRHRHSRRCQRQSLFVPWFVCIKCKSLEWIMDVESTLSTENKIRCGRSQMIFHFSNLLNLEFNCQCSNESLTQSEHYFVLQISIFFLFPFSTKKLPH